MEDAMQLYFSPLACSLATRIAFYEAGAGATYVEVDARTKRTRDGADFLEVNPIGLVPALRTDDGEVITEGAAILQYVADRFPKAELAPGGGMDRTRLQQWLCFIGTELHKALFIPLFDKTAPEGTAAHTVEKGKSRLDYLDRYLTGREFLLDRFSVADAYLYAVLNWTAATGIDLAPWPAVQAYHKRLQKRPSIAKAFAEELALYKEEQARNAKAA
jgi:glutathione S-transferase